MQLKQINGVRSTVQLVREGAAGTTEENPIDAVVVGAGPSGTFFNRGTQDISMTDLDRNGGLEDSSQRRPSTLRHCCRTPERRRWHLDWPHPVLLDSPGSQVRVSSARRQVPAATST
jgi:hypothetical protein